MNKLPNLSIGDSSFESIRSSGRIYVDKTKHLYQLADEGKFYFLSRPRRFGKSLTVSTLKCLFEGKKELFEGLWIAESGDWKWKAHPVIVIDFNEIPRHHPDIFRKTLSLKLNQTAQEYGLPIQSDFIETQFQELIVNLKKPFGTTVAVLVDEYDKPIIDHLGRGEEAIVTAKRNRDIMKSFFGVLKGAHVMPCLRFVFLTGVSKFSQVSIFSELNNLTDITMMDDYSDLLGYTQEELETCFHPHIGLLARKADVSADEIKEKLKLYYNGYRFSPRDVRVYNPFSILSAFTHKKFRNFWFETGTPSFLVNLLKEKKRNLSKIEDMKAGEAVFSSYDLDNLKPEALLFQTGYVTIREITGRLYHFSYPNQEVRTAFLETLFHSYTEGLEDSSAFLLLSGYLQEEAYDAFFETVSSIFASIPYTLESKRDEAYFHTVFYLMVCASGVSAHSKVLTCDGRIDLVMEFSDKTFIIEFKCGQSAEAALKQIHDKGYAKKYVQNGRKIILMGINFDMEKRNVGEWKLEKAGD